jgi:hypothetical protein
MTEEQEALATRLRSQGQSYAKIGQQVGVSESAVWKFLNPKLKQEPAAAAPPPFKPKRLLLPPHELNSSAPRHIHKTVTSKMRLLPKPSRAELTQRLATAVRNTAQLKRY